MGRNFVENRKNIVKGSVYVIRCDGLCKIGATQNLSSRLIGLQTANTKECKLVFKLNSDDMYLTERLLKAKYGRVNMRGEWFSLTASDIFNLKTGNYDNKIIESTGNTKEWTRIPSVI